MASVQPFNIEVETNDGWVMIDRYRLEAHARIMLSAYSDADPKRKYRIKREGEKAE